MKDPKMQIMMAKNKGKTVYGDITIDRNLFLPL